MIDRKKFYDAIRPRLFRANISKPQVDGIEAVLDEWERRGLSDLRWLAYMLATDFHETNATMQPVREAYWVSATFEGAEAWRKKNLRYYPYYGRGLPQLTWKDNYDKMGRIIGVDLVKNPDLALEMKYAVPIMFEGMLRGIYTGVSLLMFFNAAKDDPVGARRIINGEDKAAQIAGYHRDFLAALKAAT